MKVAPSFTKLNFTGGTDSGANKAHPTPSSTGSNIHSFSSKLNPLLSRMVVVNRSVDVVVLTGDPRLSIEFNSNSVSVTRNVSINVEFTFSVQECGFTSGISDPDLSVRLNSGTGDDRVIINVPKSTLGAQCELSANYTP